MPQFTHELSPERIADLAPIRERMRPLSSATTGGPTMQPDGRRKFEITHAPLEGVNRQHLYFWFRYFAVIKVRIVGGTGKPHPAYHLWHPVDHIRVSISGEKTATHLQTGLTIHIEEAFNREKRYLIDERPLVTLTTVGTAAADMQLHIFKAGYQVGHLTHTFADTPEGLRYHSTLLMGPTERGMFPGFLRRVVVPRLMTDDKLTRWLTHNVEEVSAMRAFLPALYDTVSALGENWEQQVQDEVRQRGIFMVDLDLD